MIKKGVITTEKLFENTSVNCNAMANEIVNPKTDLNTSALIYSVNSDSDFSFENTMTSKPI